MTDVTVVIPTKNRRALLLRTLASVRNQAGVHLEILVVDDGGSDDTATAVEGLGDPRARVIRHPTSRGVSAARNTGLRSATSPYIAFLDDDDLWSPTKLRNQLDVVGEESSVEWSCTGAVHIDERFRIHAWHAPLPDRQIADALLASNVVPGGGSGLLVSRSLALAVDGFDEALSSLADWDFAIRLALHSAVAPVIHPHVGYLVHQQGMMAGNLERPIRELGYLEVKHAKERAARGVRIDRDGWRQYLAGLAFRASRPALGARLRLADAVRTRRVRPLVRLAADLAPVDVTDLRVRHARATAPTGWAAEAETWLDLYRPAESSAA